MTSDRAEESRQFHASKLPDEGRFRLREDRAQASRQRAVDLALGGRRSGESAQPSARDADDAATTLNVRGIDRETADRIKSIGNARGLTIAETLRRMTRCVRELQEVADNEREDPAHEEVRRVLDRYGLLYVKL